MSKRSAIETVRLGLTSLFFALTVLLSSANALCVEATDEDHAPASFDIPLEHGRFELKELLKGLYRALDQEPPASTEDVEWNIDVESAVGESQIAMMSRLSGGAVNAEVQEERLVVRFDYAAVRKKVADDGDSIEDWIETFSSRIISWPPQAFGLTFVTDEKARASIEQFMRTNEEMPERVIVLIHGLDDPGWMWRNVIPALRSADYVVARFEYPNDGPIAEAADLLAFWLMRLRNSGAQRVDIVAHSMGGLVTRDVLTRKALYAGDGTGGERFPAVDRLVMCGTPNHGSKMVRLRAVSEIKEQISKVISGQGSWMGGLSDGSGEAAVDLMPGSDFLRRLNSRPLARHTEYAIIAGRMSPVEQKDVSRLGRRVRDAASSANAPKWLRDLIASTDEQANELLSELVRDVGDGCVTIDSARLDGVDDFAIVQANHVSMIVNLTQASNRVPPAIPILLDRLIDEE